MRVPLTKQYILDRVVEDENGCWIWQRSKSGESGYGQLGRKPYSAHVLAYTLWRQKPWLMVRHLCHVPPCCNPFHLEEGTGKQNWEDSREMFLQLPFYRVGKESPNAKAVLFKGARYPSIEAARLAWGVSWTRVKEEGELL